MILSRRAILAAGLAVPALPRLAQAQDQAKLVGRAGEDGRKIIADLRAAG